jgi:hypothetical protein
VSVHRGGDPQVLHDPSRLVSDAERDAVVGRLQSHYVEGRLTLSQLDQRTGRALESRSFGELAESEQGLPARRAAPCADANRDVPYWGRLSRHRASLAAVAVAMGGVSMWWFS